MSTNELSAFVSLLSDYRASAKKWNGLALIASFRRVAERELGVDRAGFDRLALAAHRADLLELRRADLADTVASALGDVRYLEESEIVVGSYSFHFISFRD